MKKIIYKKVGANLSVVIDDKRLSKRVTKEEGEGIKALYLKHNDAVERNLSDKYITTLRNKIEKMLTKNTTEKKKKEEKKKIASKAINKRLKKPVKEEQPKDSLLLKELKDKTDQSELTDLEVQKMERLLKKHKEVNIKESKVSSESGTKSRERYR